LSEFVVCFAGTHTKTSKARQLTNKNRPSTREGHAGNNPLRSLMRRLQDRAQHTVRTEAARKSTDPILLFIQMKCSNSQEQRKNTTALGKITQSAYMCVCTVCQGVLW